MDEYDILTQLREQLAQEKKLNENLKRICRERANAARRLQPKKEHSGYVILSSGQYTQRYTIEVDHATWRRENPTTNIKEYRRFITKEEITWKTTIQTFYDATLPLKTIEDSIWKELSPILSEMGIAKRSPANKNGEYCRFRNNYFQEVNGIYKWIFKANCKTGFWELDIFTTDAVVIKNDKK